MSYINENHFNNNIILSNANNEESDFIPILAEEDDDSLNDFKVPVIKDYAFHSYWMFSILVDRRDELMEFLKENGIETRPFFYPMHIMPVYKQNIVLKNAEEIHKR